VEAPLPVADSADVRPVFLGDSITVNWPLAQLQRNYAVAGENSDSISAKVRPALGSGKPLYLHILAGTNDDIRNPARTFDNIATMVRYAQSLGVKVYVGTIPPYDQGLFWQAPYAAAFNSALKDHVSALGAVVVDYYAHMVDDKGAQIPALFVDGIHPSAAGYEKMDLLLTSLLKEK
jgi:lysophospholipase L1-like esterase